MSESKREFIETTVGGEDLLAGVRGLIHEGSVRRVILNVQTAAPS